MKNLGTLSLRVEAGSELKCSEPEPAPKKEPEPTAKKGRSLSFFTGSGSVILTPERVPETGSWSKKGKKNTC